MDVISKPVSLTLHADCTGTQEVQEIIKIKGVKSFQQRENTCGMTSSKRAVPVGFFKSTRTSMGGVVFFWGGGLLDDTLLHWITPLMAFNLQLKDPRDGKGKYIVSAWPWPLCRWAPCLHPSWKQSRRYLTCSSEAFLLLNIFAGPDLLLASISATVMLPLTQRDMRSLLQLDQPLNFSWISTKQQEEQHV